MKIIDLKQGSKDWKVWRELGLGASDAPAVMGDSPWTSPFQLWLEKTGYGKRPKPNQWQKEAMDRGNRLEPKVRMMFEELTGLKYPPLVAHLEDHPHIRASFDGYNKDTHTLLEIKCPNRGDHQKALDGEVPEKYKAQLQHQFLVSGATHGHYVSYYSDESELGIVEVFPDLVYMSRLRLELNKFWRGVQKKVMPEAAAKDLKNILESGLQSLDNLKNTFEMLSAVLGLAKKASEEVPVAQVTEVDEEGLIRV